MSRGRPRSRLLASSNDSAFRASVTGVTPDDFPKAPKVLKARVARDHFDKLVRRFYPPDLAQRPHIVDLVVSAARLFAKLDEIEVALADAEPVYVNERGGLSVHPLIAARKSVAGQYLAALRAAGLAIEQNVVLGRRGTKMHEVLEGQAEVLSRDKTHLLAG